MSDKKVVETLLLETHRHMAAAAMAVVEKIGSREAGPGLTYPPNGSLSAGEEQALRSMDLSAVQRAALQKVVADACAAAFFDFFNLIDATADPEVKPPRGVWLGASITAPKDDRDREMLHDAFFDSYSDYEKTSR